MTLSWQTWPGQKARSPRQDEPRGPFAFLYFPALSALLLKQEQAVLHAEVFPLAIVKAFSSTPVTNPQHIVAGFLCAQRLAADCTQVRISGHQRVGGPEQPLGLNDSIARPHCQTIPNGTWWPRLVAQTRQITLLSLASLIFTHPPSDSPHTLHLTPDLFHCGQILSFPSAWPFNGLV